MIHLMDAIGGKSGKIPIYLREQLFSREDLIVLFGGCGVQQESGAVRSVIEPVSDLIDFVNFDARGVKTIVNRTDRKISGVLLSAEPLLCSCGDQFAIHK